MSEAGEATMGSTTKISEWLKLMTSISKYESGGSRMGVQINCNECGRTLRGEQVRTLDILGISDLTHKEEERVFRNICSECYSNLRPQIDNKMK